MPKLFYFKQSARETTHAILSSTPHCKIDVPPKRRSVAEWIRDIASTEIKKGDIVLIDTWGRNAFIISALKIIRRYRTVIRLRGDPYRALREKGGGAPRIEKIFMKVMFINTDLVIFNSNHVRNYPSYSYLTKRSAMVYNPLMTGTSTISPIAVEHRPATSALRVLSVTNFDYPAKIRPLAHALRHWIDSRFLEEKDITWSIVGAGKLFERFKDEVELPAGETRVTFHGFRRDVAEFYKTHHVFAHLSGFDSLPNVALEAAAHGLPIITIPQSGGTLEAMRDGETGRIVSDGEGFRRAILEYRDDPELRRAHGRNGREFVLENFTIERQAAKMKALLAERFGIGVE